MGKGEEWGVNNEKSELTLHKIRTTHTILANGHIERFISFRNNDLPGVMLASSFEKYIHRYGVVPDTNPVIQTKNDISYVINNSSNELCNLYPCASVTKNAEGKEMNDLMDLNNEGAIAFSDPKIEDTELILNTLLYLKQFDGLYISKPKEKYFLCWRLCNWSDYTNQCNCTCKRYGKRNNASK